jgi:hypothetical protein
MSRCVTCTPTARFYLGGDEPQGKCEFGRTPNAERRTLNFEWGEMRGQTQTGFSFGARSSSEFLGDGCADHVACKPGELKTNAEHLTLNFKRRMERPLVSYSAFSVWR